MTWSRLDDVSVRDPGTRSALTENDFCTDTTDAAVATFNTNSMNTPFLSSLVTKDNTESTADEEIYSVLSYYLCCWSRRWTRRLWFYAHFGCFSKWTLVLVAIAHASTGPKEEAGQDTATALLAFGLACIGTRMSLRLADASVSASVCEHLPLIVEWAIAGVGQGGHAEQQTDCSCCLHPDDLEATGVDA